MATSLAPAVVESTKGLANESIGAPVAVRTIRGAWLLLVNFPDPWKPAATGRLGEECGRAASSFLAASAILAARSGEMIASFSSAGFVRLNNLRGSTSRSSSSSLSTGSSFFFLAPGIRFLRGP